MEPISSSTNLQHYREKIYSAKYEVFEELDGQWQSPFSLFAPYLGELRSVNQANTVVLEVDQDNRFFCGLR